MVPVTMTVVIANWCSGDVDGDVSWSNAFELSAGDSGSY